MLLLLSAIVSYSNLSENLIIKQFIFFLKFPIPLLREREMYVGCIYTLYKPT